MAGSDPMDCVLCGCVLNCDNQCDKANDCLCWVGHGGCGGCSGYPGIAHEPACGWEWNPKCPEHN